MRQLKREIEAADRNRKAEREYDPNRVAELKYGR